MGPGQRAVSFEIADMAVEIERIAGEQRLLSSQVSQSIQTLTTLTHEVQAEQLRAREDRMAQMALLTTLTERSAGIAGAELRVQALESKVGYWRGVFVGFGALATVVAGMAVAWVTGQFQQNAGERGRLEARIERLENRR